MGEGSDSSPFPFDQNIMSNPCPKCKAYHGVFPLEHIAENEDCGFDPNRPCKTCGHKVSALSMGGPDVCPWCDSGTPGKDLSEECRQNIKNQIIDHKYKVSKA